MRFDSVPSSSSVRDASSDNAADSAKSRFSCNNHDGLCSADCKPIVISNYSNCGNDRTKALYRFENGFGRLCLYQANDHTAKNFHINDSTQFCQLDDLTVSVRFSDDEHARLLNFPCPKATRNFLEDIWQIKKEKCTQNNKSDSVFDQRTEEASASQYFQFYGYLSQQQNMLQDYVRTFTYQKAVLSNLEDFKDKIILDVGAGSGILSFFAAQAGAKRVYAVEASNMAQCCETLVENNGLKEVIKVLSGKIEDVHVPEQVDTIISEPMGYMLLNERMLETFLHAKKFLKPGGKMYPTCGDLHIAPFTDEALFLEQCSKANFWCQNSFHGVNLTSLANKALKEYFRQPVVDTFHPAILMARSVMWSVDFSQKSETDLHLIDIPLEFTLLQTGYIHGLAFWFDVAFLGTGQSVYLSTAPTEPLTHWYQVRCLLEQPLLGYKGWTVTGRVLLVANKRQSYDVELELVSAGNTARNTLDLKNPCFRYNGQPVQPPPGQHTTSPTESYWAATAAAAQAAAALQPQAANYDKFLLNHVPIVNGSLVTPPGSDHMYQSVAQDIAVGSSSASLGQTTSPLRLATPMGATIPLLQVTCGAGLGGYVHQDAAVAAALPQTFQPHTVTPFDNAQGVGIAQSQPAATALTPVQLAPSLHMTRQAHNDNQMLP